MSEDRSAPKSGEARKPYQKVLGDSYYGLLGVHPSASMRDIRQAYWDLSKLYHPDTTTLPTAIATAKFQQLNEAYATLSNPERRGVYDRKIGYSTVAVVQPLPNLNAPPKQIKKYQSSAYLDPTDRPLSPGELFALFILAVTLVGCLCLAIMVGLTRGEALLQPKMVQNDTGPGLVQPDSVTPPATAPLPKRELSPVPLQVESGQNLPSPELPEPEDNPPASPASRSVPSGSPASSAAVSVPPIEFEPPALPPAQPPVETPSPPGSLPAPLPQTPS